MYFCYLEGRNHQVWVFIEKVIMWRRSSEQSMGGNCGTLRGHVSINTLYYNINVRIDESLIHRHVS